MSGDSLGVLACRAKFAREALADLPASATPHERAAALTRAAAADNAYRLALPPLSQVTRAVAGLS